MLSARRDMVPPMQPRLSVLVVEDEPIIAMMVEEFLDVLGHDVAGIVDNVPDALARVADGDFDLAILDVTLREGAACWPVAAALAEQRIPYILASGGILQRQFKLPDATILVFQGLVFVMILFSDSLYGRFAVFQEKERPA